MGHEMKNRTIKPKKVTVIFHREVIEIFRSEYTCPSCKVNFYNDGPKKNVTRFRCSCGQELIVEAA
jgi:hypothetical protein